MGKKLKQLGLRNESGQPTDQAIQEGYCKSTPLKDGTAFFMWHKHKVAHLMQSRYFVCEKKEMDVAWDPPVVERDQLVLFSERLDEVLPSDHPVSGCRR